VKRLLPVYKYTHNDNEYKENMVFAIEIAGIKKSTIYHYTYYRPDPKNKTYLCQLSAGLSSIEQAIVGKSFALASSYPAASLLGIWTRLSALCFMYATYFAISSLK
jgi:hypothetical protein